MAFNLTEVIQNMFLRKWDSRTHTITRYAPWSVASQIDNKDGENLEDTIGDIKGITDSLNSTNSGYALSSTAGKKIVQGNLGNCVLSYDNTNKKYYAQYGADSNTKMCISEVAAAAEPEVKIVTQTVEVLKNTVITGISFAAILDASSASSPNMIGGDSFRIKNPGYNKMRVVKASMYHNGCPAQSVRLEIKSGNSTFISRANGYSSTSSGNDRNEDIVSDSVYDLNGVDDISFSASLSGTCMKNTTATIDIDSITLYKV